MPAADLCQLSLPLLGQLGFRYKLGGEEAGHPLLATSDQEPAAVLLLGPLHRQSELAKGLVEGGEVAVALSVSQDPIAIED